MKLKLTLLFLSVLCAFKVHAVKGLYVNGFATILGNTQKEDSLLNYAQQNQFTYLALYEMHIVHSNHDLTNVASSQVLADFIHKAKTQFAIEEVGACAENFWWFDHIASVYNSIHPDTNQQIDVYNLEFEFWVNGSVGPGQYYCTTYLQPAGYTCDTAGAFAFYMRELTSIDSLAAIDGTTSEIYVGWFNDGQATALKSKADRILLHSYVTNANNVYGYAQTRLSYLGNSSGTVNVLPIFSSEPSFLGPYLVSNNEISVFDIYQNDFTNETAPWKSNINLLGYQWFDYSDMPYQLPLSLPDNTSQTIKVYPNPVNDVLMIETNEILKADIILYDVQGRAVLKEITGSAIIPLNMGELKCGVYFLSVSTHKGNQVFRILH